MGRFISSMKEFISENRNLRKYVPSIESFLTEMARYNTLDTQGSDTYVRYLDEFTDNGYYTTEPLSIYDTDYEIIFMNARNDMSDLKKDSEEEEEVTQWNKSEGLGAAMDEYGNPDVFMDIDVIVKKKDSDKYEFYHKIAYIRTEQKEGFTKNSVGYAYVSYPRITNEKGPIVGKRELKKLVANNEIPDFDSVFIGNNRLKTAKILFGKNGRQQYVYSGLRYNYINDYIVSGKNQLDVVKLLANIYENLPQNE